MSVKSVKVGKMKADGSRMVSPRKDGSQPRNQAGGEVYVLRIDRARIIRQIISAARELNSHARKN
jgi:hypothetical protein